jgi:hypothetical protein
MAYVHHVVCSLLRSWWSQINSWVSRCAEVMRVSSSLGVVMMACIASYLLMKFDT